MAFVKAVFVYLAVSLLAAGAVIVVSFSIWTEPTSASQTTPPAYTHSWYITNTGSNAMYFLGAVDGQLDYATCTKGVAVLDFGQPDKSTASSPYGGYGINIFDSASTFKSDADIVVAAVSYAQGWFAYSGWCPRLKLAIGTNNYHMMPSGNGGVVATAGANWAQVAYDVQQFLNALGYGWQIQAWSGSDMAQPSGTSPVNNPDYWWDCPGPTKNFVNGWLFNPNKPLLVDFGTAWAGVESRCPWSVTDVYDVAYKMF